MNCLVAGAGGFIGGHLVKRLLADGHFVRAVDLKPWEDWWQLHSGSANCSNTDLREYSHCSYVCLSIDQVYNLASDMGGIGFIETHRADCMTSVLINTNLLRAAVKRKVSRYFYASSACVYHELRQNDTHRSALKESDVYVAGGAMPEDGYGWEKLFSERMCRHFREDYGLETRVARFHNIYGPLGSWNDGREKAPAALCRKVATAKLKGADSFDVWGDGSITRSFCWIDDCVEGIIRLTDSDYSYPLNVGSDELVSVDCLIDKVECAAGYLNLHLNLRRIYDPTKPQGVVGRNSDNTLIKEVLGWSPSTSLQEGIMKTYKWVEDQVRSEL